jgi:hypothetical protein
MGLGGNTLRPSCGGSSEGGNLEPVSFKLLSFLVYSFP